MSLSIYNSLKAFYFFSSALPDISLNFMKVRYWFVMSRYKNKCEKCILVESSCGFRINWDLWAYYYLSRIILKTRINWNLQAPFQISFPSFLLLKTNSCLLQMRTSFSLGRSTLRKEIKTNLIISLFGFASPMKWTNEAMEMRNIYLHFRSFCLDMWRETWHCLVPRFYSPCPIL